MRQVVSFIKDDDGLTVVEYAAVAGLISATIVATFTTLGNTVAGLIDAVVAVL